jgi:hypothetical protein
MSTTDTPTTIEDAIARVDAVLAELRALAPPAAPGTLAAIGDVVSGELIESAWGNAVGDHIDELDLLIHRTPTGTGGNDFLDLATPPNIASVRVRDISRFEAMTPGSPSPAGFHFGSSAGGWGLHVGGYNAGGDPWPRPIVGIVAATGSGDPAWFYKLGSRDPGQRVRIQFQNVTDIEASVPWPVASSIDLKAGVEDVGEVPDLRELRVVRYVRADDPAATERIGFVAEELGAAMPEAAVSSDVGTTPAYLNEVVTAVLVATVQSLLDRVEALESAAGA